MSSRSNALGNASSSYLRSALHQPIHWHQWGPEAFAAAQQENKPILLDIGAVWCHWCHVMDRESYDDPEVADILNREFIAIKVDRDERPDVDSRYQTAVAAITGQGGWPLTAFLTTEGKPFYGGTYFPPRDAHGRPGFKKILLAIADAYKNRRDDVLREADGMMTALHHAEGLAGHGGDFNPRVITMMVQSALNSFDPKNGGFGSAPKFPHASIVEVLLDWYARTGEDGAANVARTTLEKMAQGGVYDQIAGGFHRYSVDENWIVPHFEKMSYDNSELLRNYVHAAQLFPDAAFAETAKDIIRWVDSTLTDREHGGFYASQDADINLEDDGDYFTWTVDEAKAALTAQEFEVAALHYDINEVGEMHHNSAKNVLWIRAEVEEIAMRLSLKPDQIRMLLNSAKQKMLVARLQRPTPYIDKTVYVNWNAMFVSAYLAAGRVLGMKDAHHFALRTLDRILGQWNDKQQLPHVIAYSDPNAVLRESRGLLDDYVFTALACLDAYEATGDLTYFRCAQQIADTAIAKFGDATSGGFFDAEPTTEQVALGALSVRRKAFQDSPTPAGNPAAAILMLRLHAYTNDTRYRDKAEDTLETFAGAVEQFGIYAGTYGRAAIWFSKPHTQVVIIGTDASAADLERAAFQTFAENLSVIRLAQADAHLLPPALAETIPNVPGVNDGRAVAVVCSNFACQPPITSAQDLTDTLKKLLRS
ncbi:protein of unknown function DUF255 [Candidatus Koribacter versatilis Ellin345]|uniref:Spermatogenesis-associated protein 20-like TRX domain-containing protein n=1 Tax=Koribacter versatilis (strain Ellin345) TaxID=204669 RepID=Q1IP15_KORVE|nr:thioredoxin domain-containing protein [Candidatus Koribacter versatilis]ABF41385.1 protein of unknown function DUF255 [Candidatus Koribacter versatilis Ellin345]